MDRIEEIRARCEEKRVYHQNGAWEPESQMHADCEDLLARVERLEAVVGQAQGLFGDVIVQGECGCDGCKMKRALDKLEESDGE